ncbi:MAG: hypothetical protein HPY76_13135 [Anaerolineae bacterium]|nr:hypothetical protein [Anaerolineae bacterium]
MPSSRTIPTLVGVAMLLLAALACNLPAGSLPTAPPTAEPTQPPPATPTQPSPPEATLPPEATVPPPAGEPVEPVGFAYSSETDTRVKIRWFANGQDLVVEQASPVYPNHNNVLIAGSMPRFDPGLRPPVIFYHPEAQTLRAVYYDGAVVELPTDSMFYVMVGAPGDSAFAYTSIGQEGDSPVSTLHFSLLENMPNLEVWLQTSDTDWFVIHPLAVQGEGASPWKVWFTRHAYGIGGDIVFAPMRGLFSIDQATKSVVQVLGDDRLLTGLSDDTTWAASIPLDFSEAGSYSLQLRELASGRVVEIPIGANANRGAGNVVFSPGNALVAWMEGNGYRMAEVPDFTSRVRVARIDGSPLLDVPDADFAAALGLGRLAEVRPRAWMTQNLLLVEVRSEDWADVRLATLDANDGSIRQVASGAFLGLVYP